MPAGGSSPVFRQKMHHSKSEDAMTSMGAMFLRFAAALALAAFALPAARAEGLVSVKRLSA